MVHASLRRLGAVERRADGVIEAILDASVPGIPGGTGRTFDWAIAAEVAQGFADVRLDGARAVVQGFGSVGMHAARFLEAHGARLVRLLDGGHHGVKLTDDETGGSVNRAFQHCSAAGVDLVVLHHQRKGDGTSKPGGMTPTTVVSRPSMSSVESPKWPCRLSMRPIPAS